MKSIYILMLLLASACASASFQFNITAHDNLSLAPLTTFNASISSNFYFLQEFANVSTAEGGLANGSYGFQTNYFYINYSFPSVTVTDAIWQIRHGSLATYNVTIPESCFSYNPSTLQLRVRSDSFVAALSHSWGECYNGAWTFITSNSSAASVALGGSADTNNLVDGNYSSYDFYFSGWKAPGTFDNGGRVYEEAIWWKTSTLNNYSTTNGTISANEFSAYSNITVTANTYVPLLYQNWSNANNLNASLHPISLNVTVVNANTLAVVTASTNITVLGTYFTYENTTTTGSVLFRLDPGTYVINVQAQGYSANQLIATVGTEESNVTVYVDESTQLATFAVRDTLDNPVENATVTFSRGINGSIIGYAQIVTDFSGLFSLYLNPGITYSVSAVQSNYAPFTGNVQPSQSSTYVIRMQFPPNDPYETVLDGVFYAYDATFDNATNLINITWEVTSLDGSLDSLSMNTTYLGTDYNNSLVTTTSGLINITITGNLSLQNQFNVTFNFTKSDGTSFQITVPFYFPTPIIPAPASATGGFCTNMGPGNQVGKAMLATLILMIVIAGVWAISGSIEAVMVAAIIVIGFFTMPACAFFSLRFGLISIAVLVVMLIADVVAGR